MQIRKDFSLAISAFFKTLPFLMVRIGLAILFAIFVVIYFGAVLWTITNLIGGLGSIISIIVLIIAFIIFLKLYSLISKYVFYMAKAAHIAVVAEYIKKGKVPKGQIGFGFGKIKKHFLSSSGLFAVDMTIEAILRDFTSALRRIIGKIPIEQLRTLLNLLLTIFRIFVSYVDEAIISYIFFKEGKDTWKSARDGIVLYAKNWKELMAVIGVIVLVMYGIVLLLFNGITMLSAGIQYGEEIAWAIAIGITALLYIGIIQPFAEVAIVSTFLNEMKGDTPDSKTLNWLKSISSKFKEMVEKKMKKALK